MKIKRTERLIDMTQYLVSNPVRLIPLSYFANKYESAKSSISEDLVLVKETFETRGTGTIETVPGSAGGVRFLPLMQKYEAKQVMNFLKTQLEDPERILPGEYVYLSDLLGSPNILARVGKLIATPYMMKHIDVVMTVATKGVPLAQAVARELGVPFVIVRRDSKITEGSTVSVNYASASSKRVEKMELSKRSLNEGDRVLIVDDFLKGGGTINGMCSLVEEFGAKVVGISVFVESKFHGKNEAPSYTSLLCVDELDYKRKYIVASLGNYIEKRK
ncbi:MULTISPECIES: pur operon repressor [unclassified Granulicatella]|uniref:pur operon repressor n=1 Tax=unclassified Granulicatella TaxID=2630493 RepID=UPI0010746547|nr:MULTISPECIES: pur operon repressor [unclassified Granulicatella]MBF0779902.1 pur operon repressor [Granulicatella sp. 19428wC4_WM01]TFU96013.1 pur operon repressor [Granulicatella sp. WM01]